MAKIPHLSLKNRFTLWILSIALSCCWGSAFIFNELIFKDLPRNSMTVATIVIYRLLLASCLANLLCKLYQQSIQKIFIKQGFILGGVGMLIPFLFITAGQTDLSAGMTGVLAATVPLFTILVAYCWQGTRFSMREIAGCFLIMLGVCVLFAHDLQADNYQAAILVLSGVLCFGIVNVYGAINVHRYTMLSLTAGMLNTACILLIPAIIFIVWQGGIVRDGLSGMTLLKITGLAIFPTLVATLLFFYILRQRGEVLAAVAGALVPVSVVIMDAALLNHSLSISFYFALCLVIVGSLIAI